ncbi:hypothetical protein [Flavihumibacter fluvii]|uniref:hypothetical protein n=1 Tax=Flavihumibacter fluvii TaxID=2838157 RepID=UPI001BDEC538|nr:hypothetical protein [Flavihumibacter fluvii]ULQ51160.1 hypothetical protein KJS93_13810 [Flavihumibacter fluvii]
MKLKSALLNTITLLCVNCIVSTISGQETLPVNSNLLIEYGISPRVLDAALSTTLQSGSFKQKVHIIHDEGDVVKKADFIFIYDPNYKDGIDIQIAYDKDSIGYLERKTLLKLMQQMHSFSRKSASNLYDEKSLKVVSIKEDEVVLSFLYDAEKLEPELKYGKKAKGLIYIKNKELVKVELTNTKPVKILGQKVVAGEYTSTIYYRRTTNNGGHIESSSEEHLIYARKGKSIKTTIYSETIEYKDVNGIAVNWEEKPATVSTENMEILDKSLGGALPIFGKGALKLGYKLPRPIGVNAFMHFQSQTLKLNDIQVGFNGGELVDVSSLVKFDASSVPQNSQIESFRADVWVFPFLNLSAMVGKGRNRLDGKIFLSDELIDVLERYGWLIGIDKDDVPEFIPVQTDLTSVTWGGGATLAGGVGNFNLSLAYQIAWAKVLEVNTNKFAQVISPSIGYRIPSNGINIMVGAQGQFYNTLTAGSIKLPNPNGTNNSLDFAVNFKPINWNFIVGFYAPVTDHFDISIQSGWGGRRSLTAVVGYRF